MLLLELTDGDELTDDDDGVVDELELGATVLALWTTGRAFRAGAAACPVRRVTEACLVDRTTAGASEWLTCVVVFDLVDIPIAKAIPNAITAITAKAAQSGNLLELDR